MNSIVTQLSESVKKAILAESTAKSITLDDSLLSNLIEKPKDKRNGDFATTAPLKLARYLKQSPRDIASALLSHIKSDKTIFKLVEEIKIAGPGFINFSLTNYAVQSILQKILIHREKYCINKTRSKEKILIEFVSANPTGPLNAVSARAAAVGDVLATVLERSSAQICREFYINDFGNQVNILGKSLKIRCEQLLNYDVEFPEDGYHGEYLIDMAKDLILKYGKGILDHPDNFFIETAISTNIMYQKRDLENYRVKFDSWFSEKTIHQQKLLAKNIKVLKKSDHIYEKEGKLWFRATQYDDESDRVVVRDNGIPTYFMADIAYHQNKYDRGFTRLIDIWGPDHHGYIPRLTGALQALGHEKDFFNVLIVQQVNLVNDGKLIKMSKRAGKFILMEDVLNEVGTDAARFFFVMRSTDTPLDFDLELAKKHTPDNPCFYVQYAHARIHSIYKNAQKKGIDSASIDFSQANLNLLTNQAELNIIKKMGHFPLIIEQCSNSLEIHHIPYYLYELSSLFHNYFNMGKEHANLRIIVDNTELTKARIALITGLKLIIKEGLNILGVSAPESM